MGEYLEILKVLNLSRMFLLPLLKIGSENLDENGFVNCFLDDAERDERMEGVLYLLFLPHNMMLFSEFLDKERQRGIILDDYDYEGGFVVVVYKLPEEFKDDYELFYQGKYSKFSKAFKSQFPQVTKVEIDGRRKDVVSTQWSIFKRDKNLIKEWEEELGIEFGEEQELWSAPNFDREVLDLKYIEYVKHKQQLQHSSSSGEVSEGERAFEEMDSNPDS